MNSTITVRDIDPGDKVWLKREARQDGVSTEEFDRRLVHEKLDSSERRAKLSEAFDRYFRPAHSLDIPLSKCLRLPTGFVRRRRGQRLTEPCSYVSYPCEHLPVTILGVDTPPSH